MSGRASGSRRIIYIAGLATISPDFYEAARIDRATRRQMFWRITVPLVQPATITVVTLSLIGGLRSFDLIWAMTRGGPGFSSDVLASVIYKQYQAGFYGLSTAGNVILFLLIAAHHPAAHRLVQPQGGGPVTRRQYVIGFVVACRHLRRLRGAVPLRVPHRGEEPVARPRGWTSPGRPSGT